MTAPDLAPEARDPRIDPRPGDVLLVGPQVKHPTIRKVTGRHTSGRFQMIFWEQNGRRDISIMRSLQTWQKWAKNSFVMERGK